MIVKVSPKGSMDQLSQLEVDRLKKIVPKVPYTNCTATAP